MVYTVSCYACKQTTAAKCQSSINTWPFCNIFGPSSGIFSFSRLLYPNSHDFLVHWSVWWNIAPGTLQCGTQCSNANAAVTTQCWSWCPGQKEQNVQAVHPKLPYSGQPLPNTKLSHRAGCHHLLCLLLTNGTKTTGEARHFPPFMYSSCFGLRAPNVASLSFQHSGFTSNAGTKESRRLSGYVALPEIAGAKFYSFGAFQSLMCTALYDAGVSGQ